MNGRTFVLIFFCWAALTIITPTLLLLSESSKRGESYNGPKNSEAAMFLYQGEFSKAMKVRRTLISPRWKEGLFTSFNETSTGFSNTTGTSFWNIIVSFARFLRKNGTSCSG